MAATQTTAELIRQVAATHRVVLLGGLSIIAHGHSRPTDDADIWLDPHLPVEEWAETVWKITTPGSLLRVVRMGDWQPISLDELVVLADEHGVIRILGASQPLDIFRKPNELEIEEFEAVWKRSTLLDDGTRLPDLIDLLVTKQETGRTKDTQDISFLETEAEKKYVAELPAASAEKATEMLGRFLTPKVAESALLHPAEAVREIARQFLTELAEAGDPFAAEILRRP